MIWAKFGPLNEAHNGYLESYLNLGLIGVALLIAFLITSYGKIYRQLKTSLTLASLCLAIWTILLFYNMSEAAFTDGILWLLLLLGASDMPERAKEPTSDLAVFGNRNSAIRFSKRPLETAHQRR